MFCNFYVFTYSRAWSVFSERASLTSDCTYSSCSSNLKGILWTTLPQLVSSSFSPLSGHLSVLGFSLTVAPSYLVSMLCFLRFISVHFMTTWVKKKKTNQSPGGSSIRLVRFVLLSGLLYEKRRFSGDFKLTHCNREWWKAQRCIFNKSRSSFPYCSGRAADIFWNLDCFTFVKLHFRTCNITFQTLFAHLQIINRSW